MVTMFPSALQLPPECFGAPVNKPHTLTDEDKGFYANWLPKPATIWMPED